MPFAVACEWKSGVGEKKWPVGLDGVGGCVPVPEVVRGLVMELTVVREDALVRGVEGLEGEHGGVLLQDRADGGADFPL
jgi:hypothetical protein